MKGSGMKGSAKLIAASAQHSDPLIPSSRIPLSGCWRFLDSGASRLRSE